MRACGLRDPACVTGFDRKAQGVTLVHRHFVIIAALFILALAAPLAAFSDAGQNLLNNGNLARGSGDSCDGWRTDAWILSPTATSFSWIRPDQGHPGQLEVDTTHDNDARWTQTLSLGGGWYRISVWARSEDALPFFTGANISVLEDGIVSADLRGTQPWQKLVLYLKIPHYGADIDVALRLGGYMNLTRGKAFFHDPEVMKIDAPPAGATHIYDLGQIRKSETGAPIGHRWTLYATYLLLAAAAVIGWRLFMLDPKLAAAPQSAPAAAKPVEVIARKRRKKKSQRRG
jgi:hypothetical protein